MSLPRERNSLMAVFTAAMFVSGCDVGRYQIATAGRAEDSVWVVDTKNGRVVRCIQVSTKPLCGEWSEAPGKRD
jgi:hypothetical protein